MEVRIFARCQLQAKMLLTDEELIVGSTNWTHVSQRNVEREVALELSETAQQAEVDQFNALWASAKPYTGRSAVSSSSTPARVRRSATT